MKPLPPLLSCRLLLPGLLILFVIMTSPMGTLRAAPKSFTEIPAAIAEAKKGNQLLLFVLLKSLSEESEAVEKILQEDMVMSEKEFVIVRCKHSQTAHRKMFADKFKLDPEKAPMAVVTDADGGVLASASGAKATTYRTLVALARAKNEFETNIEKVRTTIAKVAEDDKIVDGPIGKKVAEMGNAPVLLINKRTWTFKDGKKLKAGLLEAKGPTGVFIGDDGKQVELPFNSLSAEDIAFLQKTLK